jgi:hypothetical protein
VIRGIIVNYKNQIPIGEIRELCDLAIELENAKRRVQKSIRRGYVYSQDFVRLQSLTERFIFSLVGIIRRVASPEDAEVIAKDLAKDLEFNEFDKRRLRDELFEQPKNFPMISLYITRVEKLLYSNFLDILRNVVNIKREGMIREFVMSTYNTRGLTPKPSLIRELVKKEKEEEEE